MVSVFCRNELSFDFLLSQGMTTWQKKFAIAETRSPAFETDALRTERVRLQFF